MFTSSRLFRRSSPDTALQTPLNRAIAAARPAIFGLIGFSSVTSILSLVPAIYMINVFDHVMSSRNTATLVMLTAIALFLILTSSVVDRLRAMVALRVGLWCDERVAPPLLAAVQDAALRTGVRNEAQTLRELDSFREFWTGTGIHLLVKVAWAPLFVAILFFLHPVFGLIALGGVAIVAVLTFANERATSQSVVHATISSQRASSRMSSAIRNIEVMHAMGMRETFRRLWIADHRETLAWQSRSSDRAAVYSVLSSFVQTALGIGILGAGAYLAIHGEISAGAIFAARIIFGRAVSPMIEIVKQWKSYVSSSLAYHNVQEMFRNAEDTADRVLLPPPEGALSLRGVILEHQQTRRIILRNITFDIDPAEAVAVIGPSGSGKSTLMRAIVGVLPPVMGEIRLDGAELKHWQVEQLGSYIGYVPQEVDLMAGTIAQNICRFGKRNDDAIVEAAKLVGAHELILQLSDGYNTRIDLEGGGLSGGQRQRIALARAVYGEPALLVLDEPNSNLDAAGEQALIRAIRECKRLGMTVIIVTHKAQILAVMDKVMFINGGTISQYGPRDEVMARIGSRNVVPIPGKHISGE
ncbi:type I secretion system permease/ATPase [Pseudochelatococcus sp. B33]